MATLAQIRQRVSLKLQDADNNSTQTSASAVDSEINRSIRYYSNSRFWFNEELTTITLVADQQLVPSIPSDLVSELQVNGLMVIDAQVNIDLVKLAPNNFFSNDFEQTGRPSYYTYRDNQFLLLPIPNQAYPLVLRYLKKYSDLVADGDTNDFTDEAEDLIMLHTLKNMYAENKQDPQLAGYYGELERLELRALKERTDNRNSSGYLQTDSLLISNY